MSAWSSWCTSTGAVARLALVWPTRPWPRRSADRSSPCSARPSARTCSSGRARRRSRRSPPRPGTSRCTRRRAGARTQFRRIRFDTLVGMAFSNLIAFAIMLATAATLHVSGHDRHPDSAARRPRRCARSPAQFAFAPVRMGIIGTGLLAVPVLAGSAAFAVGEVFGWKKGLENTAAAGDGLLCDHRRRDADRRAASTGRRSTRSRRCSGARC